MSDYLLECIDCKKQYVETEAQYLCPSCGVQSRAMEPLRGALRAVYDYEGLKEGFRADKLKRRGREGPWRYRELMPFSDAGSLPPLVAGMTPLRAALRLGSVLGIEELWLKDDTGLPTGSFKDRATQVVLAKARESRAKAIGTASTGNAASSLSAMAASAGMDSVIFVPASAPRAKLTQIAVCGARLIPVDGSYDQAFDLSVEASSEFGWTNRNTVYNPYTVEGKKTAAFEIWEDLGYKAPDWVVVPTGDGCILAGIEKGFADLFALGLIEQVPKLAAIQAKGCAPIVDAVLRSEDEVRTQTHPSSIADSIVAGAPRGGRWALGAIRETGGAALAVTDAEILAALGTLARLTGIFVEPAAAAGIAGLEKLIKEEEVSSDETVVVLLTGTGLKDVPAATRTALIPKPIEPTLEAVKRRLSTPPFAG